MKHISALFITLAALLLAACDTWEPALDAKTGDIDLTALQCSVDPTVTVVTRAGDTETIDISNYLVTISDQRGDQVAAWRYADMPGVVTLPVGDYTIAVASHNPKPLEWDNPLYAGSTRVSVADGEIARPGAIVCKAAGAKVSIAYSDALQAALGADCEVKVWTGDDAVATFARGEVRTACFNTLAETASLLYQFAGEVNGVKVTTAPQAVSGVRAACHYKLTVSLRTGTVDPEIVVDVQVDEEDVDINIGKDLPSITSATLDISGVTELTEANAADLVGVIDIAAPKGISELHVKIECDNLAAEDLEAVGLASEFDLAHPGDLAEALGEGLGFPVGDQVIDQTEVKFDITPFLSLLCYFPGNNNFTIRVVDNAGNEAVQMVRFYVPAE